LLILIEGDRFVLERLIGDRWLFIFGWGDRFLLGDGKAIAVFDI
jgi:hypothetical protein